MKRIIWTLMITASMAGGIYLLAADHIDAPAVGLLIQGVV